METTKQAPVRRISIGSLKVMLGDHIAKQLSVIHAISGCDTTSALFGHGKGKIFRKITDNRSSVMSSNTLACHTASLDNIVAAGLQLLVNVYGGKPGDENVAAENANVQCPPSPRKPL